MNTKIRPVYRLSTGDPLQTQRHRLKMRGCKKIFHANGSKKKKAGVPLFISDKQDFIIKTVTRNKNAT